MEYFLKYTGVVSRWGFHTFLPSDNQSLDLQCLLSWILHLLCVFFPAMKLSLLIAAAATVGPAVAASGVVQGFDISAYQPDPDFEAAYKDGARFVIIKVGCSIWQHSTFLLNTRAYPLSSA